MEDQIQRSFLEDFVQILAEGTKPLAFRDVTLQAKICMKIYCKGEKEPSRKNLQPLLVKSLFSLKNMQSEMHSFTFLSLVNKHLQKCFSELHQ